MPVNSRYDPSGKLTRGAEEHHRPEPLWRTGPAVPAPSQDFWVDSPPAWYSPDRPTCSPASTERRSLWLRKPSPAPSVAIPTRQLSSPPLRVPSLPPNVSSWSDDSRLAVTSYLSSQLWPRVPSPDLPPVRPSLRGTVSAFPASARTRSQRALIAPTIAALPALLSFRFGFDASDLTSAGGSDSPRILAHRRCWASFIRRRAAAENFLRWLVGGPGVVAAVGLVPPDSMARSSAI